VLFQLEQQVRGKRVLQELLLLEQDGTQVPQVLAPRILAEEVLLLLEQDGTQALVVQQHGLLERIGHQQCVELMPVTRPSRRSIDLS